MRAPLVVPALLFVAAIVAARGCHGAAPTASTEVTGVIVDGIVAGDVAAERWGDAFELLATGGARFLVGAHDAVVIGERLRLRATITPFDEPRNPGEPSQAGFARERGLYARLTDARVIARAPPDPMDLLTLPARVRAVANSILHRYLAEPDATILAGMLYGARGALPPELRAEFQDTGTVHVLVTAGLHLGVIAALVTFVFARIGIPRVPASLAAIPPIWAYAIVSGGHIPSLRAATMVTVALTARALGERPISLNTLALAGIVVAALWPEAVGGASFALSFSCVAAIALFADGISHALERLHVPAALREALALTLSTQLGVWPLTASTFLVIAPYAALANLFVVPVVGIALTLGLVLLALSPIAPAAQLVAHVVAWPLAWIESAVHFTAQLPFAHVVATPPPAWSLACYDAMMVVAAALLRASGKKWGKWAA